MELVARLRGAFLKEPSGRTGLSLDKRGLLFTDYLIILLILLGLLLLVGIVYYGLSGKIPSLINSIRNFLRFGG